mgnify:CR=1 FL=1
MTLGQVIRDARIAARLSIEELSESTSVRIGLLTEMENTGSKHRIGTPDSDALNQVVEVANAP